MLHLQKLGDEAFHRKNFHQAVTFYSDALEIDEEHAQLLSRRAIANSHLRNYKQAQRDAEILVKFNPHVSKVEHCTPTSQYLHFLIPLSTINLCLQMHIFLVTVSM